MLEFHDIPCLRCYESFFFGYDCSKKGLKIAIQIFFIFIIENCKNDLFPHFSMKNQIFDLNSEKKVFFT